MPSISSSNTPTPKQHAHGVPHMHLGHWLRLAKERFDARVMERMAQHPALPLGLSNLLARGRLGAAHVHIPRHLPVQGARLSELAQRAGVTKQAMGPLVTQCEAWGMVTRETDPTDARACKVRYTTTGLAWLEAYADAVDQAEAEVRAAIGPEVTAVISMGLEAYSSQ